MFSLAYTHFININVKLSYLLNFVSFPDSQPETKLTYILVYGQIINRMNKFRMLNMTMKYFTVYVAYYTYGSIWFIKWHNLHYMLIGNIVIK